MAKSVGMIKMGVVVIGWMTGMFAFCVIAAQAQAPGLDPITGIVHSLRLEQGTPLGGIGTGSIQVMTDGTISRATIHNNWHQPTGDLPGCFAAFWCRAGNQTTARVLALQNGYGLPSAPTLNFNPLFPQALMDFPDSTLPLQVSLRAFSPLIPGDLRNSSFPVAAFVFRLVNRSAAPVEISVALSWENTLGYGEAAEGTALRDRTGDRVLTLPDADGYFGLHFLGPPTLPGPLSDPLQANRGGEMTLMAYPPRRTAVVTTAGWNALDPAPSWWGSFLQNGLVSGQAPEGMEGKAVPAGVIAIQMTLKPHDSVEIPTCIAWSNPPLLSAAGDDYGRYYQLSFPDSTRAARELLGDWLSLLTLTEEWQEHLKFSNLPADLIHSIVNSVAPLVTSTLLTRDGRFTFLPDAVVGSGGASKSADYLSARLDAATLLLALYPQLEARELIQIEAAQTRAGVLPSDLQDWRHRLGPQRSAAEDDTEDGQPLDLQGRRPRPEKREVAGPPVLSPGGLENISAFVLQAAQYVDWTGDLVFLHHTLPGLRTAMSGYLQNSDLRVGSLPAPADKNGSPAPAYTPVLLTHWLEALEAARQMAHLAETRAFLQVRSSAFLGDVPKALSEVMAERRFIAACEDAAAHTLSTLARQVPPYTPTLLSPESALPEIEDAGSLTPATGWNRFYALEGFDYDLEAGRLALSPRIPGSWRMLTAPVFATTFWGRIEFKPTAHGGLFTLRIDRMIALMPTRSSRHYAGSIGGPTLVMRQLRVPGPPPVVGEATQPLPTVHVSLGPSPIGCRVDRQPSGDLLLTFDTPLSLVAGNLLEVDVH